MTYRYVSLFRSSNFVIIITAGLFAPSSSSLSRLITQVELRDFSRAFAPDISRIKFFINARMLAHTLATYSAATLSLRLLIESRYRRPPRFCSD